MLLGGVKVRIIRKLVIILSVDLVMKLTFFSNRSIVATAMYFAMTSWATWGRGRALLLPQSYPSFGGIILFSYVVSVSLVLWFTVAPPLIQVFPDL